MNRLVAGLFAGIGAAACSSPAAAQLLDLDLPAGTVGSQISALGRSAPVSIAAPDQSIWRKKVPRLQGRMDVETALRRIASRSGARIDRLGLRSFRLTARPVARPPRGLFERRTPSRHASAAPPPAEIIVTASKRELNEDSYAGQLIHLDGIDLEFGGAGGTERLSSRVSALSSTHLGAGRNKLFVRGIADSSFTGPTQSTVGQYFGDLRLSYNAPDPDLRLTDLKAVEVLAGPQGTLYGAGALGGMIRFVPNRVDLDRVSGDVAAGLSATQGGAPGADSQAVVNLPLVPGRLGIRLVATAAEEGGYIDKPKLGRTDANGTRILGGRAAARMELGEGWSVEAIGIGQKIRAADSQYADRGAPRLSRDAPVEEAYRAHYLQGQFVLEGALGDVRVRTSIGRTAHGLGEHYDATGAGEAPALFAQTSRTRMLSSENRAWRTRGDGSGWVLGLSYTHNRTTIRRSLGPPGALDRLPGVSNAIEEFTIYGEASARILPRLLLSSGFRLASANLAGGAEDAAPQAPPVAAEVVADHSQLRFLPSLSVLLDVTPESQAFLRFQQGFRPGGLAVDDGQVRRFKQDRVSTVEAGYRFRRADRDAFAFSLTMAYTDWKNIQADYLDRSGLPATVNIGNGKVWTLDAAASAALTPGLRFKGSLSLTDSSIDDTFFVGAALRAIPNIADVTATSSLVYEAPLRQGLDLKIEGWARYVGMSRLGVGPVLGEKQGGYLDSGISARLGAESIGITAGISNVANSRGNRFALGTPFNTGREQVTPLRPRTFRIGIDASF